MLPNITQQRQDYPLNLPTIYWRFRTVCTSHLDTSRNKIPLQRNNNDKKRIQDLFFKSPLQTFKLNCMLKRFNFFLIFRSWEALVNLVSNSTFQ